MSLNPARNNILVIPRGDIRAEAELCRITNREVGRECWNIERDPRTYKVPVTGRLGDICPAEVVAIGPNAEKTAQFQVGDIVGLDPAQVLHEVENKEVANWLLPARHVLCRFPHDKDRPVAVGPNIITLQDQAAQDAIRSKARSPIILINQGDGILSADGGSHMRVCFERVVSIGNQPDGKVFDDGDLDIQIEWESMFGNTPIEDMLGQLAGFAHTSSTTLRMFPERYRATPWTKVHALYEP